MRFVYCKDMENGEEIFLPRDQVEDPAYRFEGHRVRQVIPYIVIKNSEGKIGVFQRMKGDKRLVNGLTIGTGGHIEPDDQYGKRFDIFFNAAAREIEEELGVMELSSLTMTNITIESDATPVDSVHLGYVFIAELGKSLVCQDGELEWEGWKTFEELETMELESWSKIIRKDVQKWISGA